MISLRLRLEKIKEYNIMGFLSVLKKIAGVTGTVGKFAVPIAASFLPGGSPALKYISILTNSIVKAESAISGDKQGAAKFVVVDTVLESIEQIDLLNATPEEFTQLAELRKTATNTQVAALNAITEYTSMIHELHTKYHANKV